MKINFSKHKHGNDLLQKLEDNSYLSAENLRLSLGISRRSLFYLIKKVNVELKDKNQDLIENTKNIGYFLSSTSKTYLKKYFVDDFQKLSFNSATKRKQAMTFLLIEKSGLSLLKLANIFDISKNTVIRDLSQIKHSLFSYQLKIINTKKGKKMVGKEIVIRKWVLKNLNVLNFFLKDPLNKFVNWLKEQIKIFQRITGNYLTDDAKKNLSIFLFWYLHHLQNKNNQLKEKPLSQNLDHLEIAWAKNLLEDLHIKNSSETNYLIQLINSSQLENINQNNLLATKLKKIAQEMIVRFNQISGSAISSSNLVKNLTIHLMPTYYRCKYKINYQVSNIKAIKENYTNIFNFTNFACLPLEKFVEKRLPENEIALISLYFGGALKNQTLSQKENSQVLVVCSSGIGTSSLLLEQLESKYPHIRFSKPLDTLQYESLNLRGVFLVISTIELKRRLNIPIITVSPLPSNLEWQKINTALSDAHLINKTNPEINLENLIDVIGDYARLIDPDGLKKGLKKYFEQTNLKHNYQNESPSLGDLLNLNKIQVIKEKMNWKKAVQTALFPLVTCKSIQGKYIQKIINLTKKHGPYMNIGKGIMLAHGKPIDGVNKLDFSITLFKYPFLIQKRKPRIKLIIGLAPINSHSHLKLLNDLLNLLQKRTVLYKLVQSQNILEIYNLLNE